MATTDATPERLYPMELVRRTVPTPDGGTRETVYVAYLVRLSDGQHVLIDSGLPDDAVRGPDAPTAERDRNVIEQLADLGLRPQDIATVVTTHFDGDHVGHHEAFTGAEFVVQRAHDEAARGGYPRYARNRAHWDAPGLRHRTVDGDTELFPGLTLIETSGHAPGHQSVLVRLPQTGPVLLTIDAVSNARYFNADREKAPADEDGEGARASTRKLLALAEREGVALVVFGHDADQWRTLKTAPGYYE